MATDLSSLIQGGLSQTLESLLAKNSKAGQTTKAHKSDLKGQCVKVDISFDFEKFPSKWTFFIPALSATYILNVMMGESDIQATEEVDEDTLDALNEVVSNICGGLSTAINSSSFEDLGSVNFSLKSKEIVLGDDFATTENLFRFEIFLEEKLLIFFIVFDSLVMPYIEEIAQSQITEVEEDEIVESKEEKIVDENEAIESKEEDGTDVEIEEEVEANNEQNEDSTEEDQNDNEVEDTTNLDTNESTKDKEEKEDEDKEQKSKLSFLKKLNFLKIDEGLNEEEKKQAKLKKIIILVGILFGIVILVGIILYFTGAFDPEEKPQAQDLNTTKIIKKEIVRINSKPKKKNINFNISQINIKRLNKKLSLLTKYEILEEDEIERLKAIEREKEYKQRQARLELFAKNNKEEALFTKIKDKTQKIIHKNKFKQSGLNSKKNKNIENKKQTLQYDSYVQIPTLKLQKLQNFIKKSKKLSANLSICKDDTGRTKIFIGPYSSANSRDNLVKSLNKNLQKAITSLDLTKDNFKKMCKF